METTMKIRGWILGDGRSIRAVARETGISRTTIKKYLKNPEQPQYRERQPRVGHKLNAQFEARLRELFKHDLQLRRRERRTAKKFYEQLVAEGYTGSYSPVQRFVSELKKAGSTGVNDAFIPLYFAPGDALQFDWSEEYVLLGGIEHKVHVAHFRLCHSRKPFVVAYLNEKQEMVLDAFMRALAFFGGVPRRGEPPSAIGTRMQAHARRDDMALASFAGRLRDILETPMPMDPETRELDPRTLHLTPDARALLVAFSDAIEAAQAHGGDLAHITGTASKAAEQAGRIAGVLTLWRDLGAVNVEAGDMADAIELAQFYLSEASRLASAATVSAEIDRADTLRKWLLESWPEAHVLVRDVVRLGPNPLRESPKARAALGILEKHGWLVPLEAGTEVRGASRAEAWAIVKGARDVV